MWPPRLILLVKAIRTALFSPSLGERTQWLDMCWAHFAFQQAFPKAERILPFHLYTVSSVILYWKFTFYLTWFILFLSFFFCTFNNMYKE